MEKPERSVTVFSDYICPFCYIGDRRLAGVAQRLSLAVDRRFLEIHPETPPEGIPVSDLGYPPDRWRRMMEHLSRMAAGERIPLAEREFTTNSRKALLLAEAAKGAGAEAFDALNEKLFAAFFCGGRNIGDPSVLRELAEEAGVPPEIVERAWSDPVYEEELKGNRRFAARLGITGVPTFLVGNRILVGAVSAEDLEDAVLGTGRFSS